MRILYIGATGEWSTSGERVRAIEKLGHATLRVNTADFYRGTHRLERSAAFRFNIGRPVQRLNTHLLVVAKEEEFDALWVDRGHWVRPETLQLLRLKSRLRCAIHFTLDAELVKYRSNHFVRSISIYDHLVTTKPFEVELYRSLGARNLHLVPQGFSTFAQPATLDVEQREKYGCDVVFIGHRQPHYAARLNAVRGLGVRLKVWGSPKWRGYPSYAGAPVWGPDYAAALAGAKIGLGLIGRHIPETTTTRTFEIPACGVFMLAERTSDALSFFKEGVEAEFFGSDEEMKDKIRYYLAHDAERERIAAAGRLRCETSGYDVVHQMSSVLGWMQGGVTDMPRIEGGLSR